MIVSIFLFLLGVNFRFDRVHFLRGVDHGFHRNERIPSNEKSIASEFFN